MTAMRKIMGMARKIRNEESDDPGYQSRPIYVTKPEWKAAVHEFSEKYYGGGEAKEAIREQCRVSGFKIMAHPILVRGWQEF